jgi:Fe-S-cluster-containing dehydrogenase component
MSERLSKNSGTLTRRHLLQSFAAAGAAIFLFGSSAGSYTSAQRPRHSILVNLSNCIGCMRCITGCEAYHKEFYGLTEKGTAYTKVAVLGDGTKVPQLCLHCFDSPCSKVCITHAITQLDYGPVVYDRNKCIGCLLCVNQCPFGAITYDPVQRKISKCDMCSKRIESGMPPNCVQVCPTQTRTFGLYEAKLAEGLKIAEQKQGVLLYQRDTGTLYVLTTKEYEKLVSATGVTVIKKEYPANSRWVADLLQYSRIAWIPVTLGAAFYVAKWSRDSSGDNK